MCPEVDTVHVSPLILKPRSPEEKPQEPQIRLNVSSWFSSPPTAPLFLLNQRNRLLNSVELKKSLVKTTLEEYPLAVVYLSSIASIIVKHFTAGFKSSKANPILF